MAEQTEGKGGIAGLRWRRLDPPECFPISLNKGQMQAVE